MRPHDKPSRHGSPLSLARAWQYATAIANEDAMPLHRDCTSPVYREVRGVESDLLMRLEALDDPFVDSAPGYGFLPGRAPWFRERRKATAYIKVRCRKCENCLNHRRRQWTAKAILETKVSRRTWFVTLTYDPNHRFIAKAKAEKLCRTRRAEGFDMLTPNERFRAIERQTSADVTRWLKRLRKNTSAKVRYLLVSEAHKDGFPHYHLLVHETDNVSVSKRDIQGSWQAGFSGAKLVDTHDAKATGYVCKYLSKSASTRVRASQRYGDANLLASAIYEVGGAVADIRRRLFAGQAANRVREVCQEKGEGIPESP